MTTPADRKRKADELKQSRANAKVYFQQLEAKKAAAPRATTAAAATPRPPATTAPSSTTTVASSSAPRRASAAKMTPPSATRASTSRYGQELLAQLPSSARAAAAAPRRKKAVATKQVQAEIMMMMPPPSAANPPTSTERRARRPVSHHPINVDDDNEEEQVEEEQVHDDEEEVQDDEVMVDASPEEPPEDRPRKRQRPSQEEDAKPAGATASRNHSSSHHRLLHVDHHQGETHHTSSVAAAPSAAATRGRPDPVSTLMPATSQAVETRSSAAYSSQTSSFSNQKKAASPPGTRLGDRPNGTELIPDPTAMQPSISVPLMDLAHNLGAWRAQSSSTASAKSWVDPASTTDPYEEGEDDDDVDEEEEEEEEDETTRRTEGNAQVLIRRLIAEQKQAEPPSAKSSRAESTTMPPKKKSWRSIVLCAGLAWLAVLGMSGFLALTIMKTSSHNATLTTSLWKDLAGASRSLVESAKTWPVVSWLYQAPPCFADSPTDPLVHDEMSPDSYPIAEHCLGVTHRTPCPRGAFCRGGVIISCQSPYHEPVAGTLDYCVLTESANQTLAAVMQLLHTWTVHDLCVGAHPFMKKRGLGERPMFLFTQVMGEIERGYELALMHIANEDLGPTFVIEQDGWELYMGLHPQRPLRYGPLCLAKLTLKFLLWGALTLTYQALVEFPLSSMIVLMVSYVVSIILKIYWSRKKRVLDIVNCRHRVESYLTEHADRPHAQELVLTKMMWDMYPTSRAGRERLRREIFPHVKSDLNQDDRIKRTSVRLDDQLVPAWQWLVAQPIHDPSSAGRHVRFH